MNPSTRPAALGVVCSSQVRAGFSDGVQWLMWEFSQRWMRDNDVLAGSQAASS